MPLKSRQLARIDRLYSKGLILVEHDILEIEKLAKLDGGMKLGTGPAKDLRDYLKLLGELKEVQQKAEAEKKAKADAAAKASSDLALAEAANAKG